MNPKLRNIFARRSIRRYRPGKIDDGDLRDILEAAMAAPSARCKDPWRFIVVRDGKTLKAIADGLPNGKMLGDAAVGIVVCGDLNAAHDKEVSYLLQDCSAAVQNILLAVSQLGFGAVWLGVHPREDRMAHIAGILGVPAGVVPVAVISVGHPDEAPAPRTRYTESSVHWEKW